MRFILLLLALFTASHVAFGDQGLRVPIREQVYQLWRYFDDNLPSGRQLKRMPKGDCNYLLASTLYELRQEVDEALGYMSEGKLDPFISDIVVDKNSRELLKSILRSMTPDSRNPVINARFTLAAFLHLARTAGKQDGPMIRELIHAAVDERSELIKAMINTLIFRLRDRAESFAEEANLLVVNRDNPLFYLERQKHLQRAGEGLRMAATAFGAAESEDPDDFYDLALKVIRDESKFDKLRKLIREFNRDTRNRTQKEYLVRKRAQLAADLNHF